MILAMVGLRRERFARIGREIVMVLLRWWEDVAGVGMHSHCRYCCLSLLVLARMHVGVLMN